MRKIEFAARAALSFCAAAFLATACFEALTGKNGGEGTLRIFFDGYSDFSTRAGGIPDTDDFILTVTDASDGCIYSGRFGDSPETLDVPAGAYTVSAVSAEFDSPAYERPQYGDTKVVVVAAGEVASVALTCSLQNCGLLLKAEKDFRKAFPDADIYMKDSSGSLMYTYGETRTAYFSPGNVTVTMCDGPTEKTLFSRRLEARQMLSMSLSCSGAGSKSDGITIQVDTAREWLSDSYVYGQSAGGEDSSEALSVSEARQRASGSGGEAWVCGYIVGCATSTSKIEFSAPFSKSTNIVLGERSVTTDRDWCLSVELPAGDLREALNLLDNPSNLGRRVRIKGTLAPSYYGIPGLKSPTAAEF